MDVPVKPWITNKPHSPGRMTSTNWIYHWTRAMSQLLDWQLVTTSSSPSCLHQKSTCTTMTLYALAPDDIIIDDKAIEPFTNTDDWKLPGLPHAVNLNGTVQPEILEDPQVVRQRCVERELLNLHVLENHPPFPRLQAMAKSGLTLKRFAKFRVPLCGACLYGSQTLTRLQTHATPTDSTMETLTPGERILVDQLVLPTPGLIEQLSDKLTMQRYKCYRLYQPLQLILFCLHAEDGFSCWDPARQNCIRTPMFEP